MRRPKTKAQREAIDRMHDECRERAIFHSHMRSGRKPKHMPKITLAKVPSLEVEDGRPGDR